MCSYITGNGVVMCSYITGNGVVMCSYITGTAVQQGGLNIEEGKILTCVDMDRVCADLNIVFMGTRN